MSALRVPKGRIDLHEHGRDGRQAYKTTIRQTLWWARRAGIGMIFDMPNTDPPVTGEISVKDRLLLVPEKYRDNYRLYVGLTDCYEQIVDAFWCWQHLPVVIGLKLYAGRSIGSLAVVTKAAQRRIYQTLADVHYSGVVAVHCEKEPLMHPELWDPNNPISHTWARPPEAEWESVEDQIRLVKETGFRGHLHICHVSHPISVDRTNVAKALGMRISCGVTPHHILWDENMYYEADGLVYKMNPPLRSSVAVFALRHQLQDGQIDVIETDHAPHTAKEKRPPLCLSGYPSLRLYRSFVDECLPGLGLTPEHIRKLTRDRIIEIFGDKLGIV